MPKYLLDTAQLCPSATGDKYEIELKIYRTPSDTTPISLAIHLLPEPSLQTPPTPASSGAALNAAPRPTAETTHSKLHTPPSVPHPQEQIHQQLHTVVDDGELGIIDQERERALRAAQAELRALDLRQAAQSGVLYESPTPQIIAPDCIANPDRPSPESSFIDYFRRETLAMPKGKTRQSYISSLTNICSYEKGDPRFCDITVSWLRGFERFLVGNGLSTNSISVYLRNVRSIYNRAIDEELADQNGYPFRRFRIRQERTRKRSLSLPRLCELRDFECHPRLGYFRDIFMLIFYLRGINVCDLLSLTEIRNGCIEYRRSKTKRWFSVKVEPEALEIFERYRGAHHLIAEVDDGVQVDTFTKRVNRGLRSLGAPWTYTLRGAARLQKELRMESDASRQMLRTPPAPGLGLEPQGGALIEPNLVLNTQKADDEIELRIDRMLAAQERSYRSNFSDSHGVFPELTTYWARHTWATIAAGLDIPKETIAAGLGHSNRTVTDIYIDFDNRKIDEANRYIIDTLNKFGK